MDGAARLAGAAVVEVDPADEPSRRVVDGLIGARLTVRSDLVGVQGPRAGSGRADGEFWQHDGWFLKCRRSREHDDEPAALAALAELAALKRALGTLTPVRSILAVLREADHRLRLWTIAPTLVTLRERLDGAAAIGAWAALRRSLLAFAHALGVTVRRSVEDGLLLDPNPANFAVQGGRLRYLDDDVGRSHGALGVEDAFVARLTEYPGAPLEILAAYGDRFCDELALTPAAIGELALPARLASAAVLRPGSAPWVDRVRARLEALA